MPVAYVKNAFNGVVRPQAQVKGAFEVTRPALDLCESDCGAECRSFVTDDELLEALDGLELPGAAGADGAAATVAALRREGRLLDRRRRPLGASLAALATAGGRVLVLVADVAARRPLLTRDVCLPQLGRSCLYLHDACAPARLGLAVCGDGEADEPDVVMADLVTAAANPELVAAFDHVALVDPPFDRRPVRGPARRPGAAGLRRGALGRAEVDFTKAVVASRYDLDAACRRVYRALATGDATADTMTALPAQGRLRRPADAGRRLTTLAEAGLLTDGQGKKGVEQAEGKIDLATSATYRRWHERSTRRRFCGTA